MTLHLKVKFRILGRDIGQFEQSFALQDLLVRRPGSLELDLLLSLIKRQVLVNERGVLLEIV